MSRNQLVDAYQHGLIGRRAFIRGLVGVGLSVSLATAMADNVRAASTPTGSGASGSSSDIYDPVVPPTTLPNTGVSKSPTSSSHFGASLTVLGAGAAAVAAALRRKSNQTPEGQE